MDQVSLKAEPRDEFGSRPSRRLRRTGRVPAVVYGRGLETRSVAVDRRELYGVLHTEAGTNALINLDVGKDSFLTVAREIQRHPVRGEVTHLDFIQISLDEQISAEVGLELIGIPVGVREGEGIVETIRASVNLLALPTNIPGSIPIDITEMEIGDTKTVDDLPEIEGVEYTEEPGAPLVSVIVPRIVEIEEPEAELEEGEEIEGEEGEEGEAAEGAEGGAEADSGDGEEA